MRQKKLHQRITGASWHASYAGISQDIWSSQLITDHGFTMFARICQSFVGPWGSMEGITNRFFRSWPWNGCWKRDLFRAENVTSNWVIKRSLGRSEQLIVVYFDPTINEGFLFKSYPQQGHLYTPWKIKMEPTNHPFRKEHGLPNLHDTFSHINLQECTSLNP